MSHRNVYHGFTELLQSGLHGELLTQVTENVLSTLQAFLFLKKEKVVLNYSPSAPAQIEVRIFRPDYAIVKNSNHFPVCCHKAHKNKRL